MVTDAFRFVAATSTTGRKPSRTFPQMGTGPTITQRDVRNYQLLVPTVAASVTWIHVDKHGGYSLRRSGPNLCVEDGVVGFLYAHVRHTRILCTCYVRGVNHL